MERLELATPRMIAEIDGAVGRMIFNNPARRNAVSADMFEAIPLILDRFELDTAVRVVVLSGAGDKAFAAGLDISQFEERFSSPETVASHSVLTRRAAERLTGCLKPTIAMIHGFCVGAGVQIAGNCDIRIAAESASFAITAAKMGLGYPVRSMKRLVDLVGPSHAKEIFFTARQFSAPEAYAMGLIDRIVPDAELSDYVQGYCERIAANAPLTLRAVKEIVGELGRPDGELDLERCERAVKACFESTDYVEGRRAFMEKRKPVFTGK